MAALNTSFLPPDAAATPLADWPALRAQIETITELYPEAAMAQLDAQRATFAEPMVQVLIDVAADPEPACMPDYALHMLAMHWLAVGRDTRAYAPLIAIGRLDAHLVMDELLGDVVHQSYGRCLAAVCDGHLEPFKTLIEDDKASLWVRMAALDGWAVRVLEGDAERAELIAYLQDLGTREAERQTALRAAGQGPAPATDEDLGDLTLLDAVATVAADISAQELGPQLKAWIDSGVLHEEFADWAYLEKNLNTSFEEHVREMRDNGRGYPVDVQTEVAWWYHPTEVEDEGVGAAYAREALSELPQPFVRETPKVGRNDPCPCGSGKKYKKCHGA